MATAAAAATRAARKLIVGCGSNVVDAFYPVRKLPHPGDKAYFAKEKYLDAAIVGGVTLNHLSWARALGAPTGLLALQGDDDHGRQIRATMAALGVSSEHVRVSPGHTTSVSMVFVEESGERTIIMAPASTSQMDGPRVAAEFTAAVRGAAMLTTEISQVPLSGVEALLDTAAGAGVLSLLDVDVTPAIASGAARLGTLDQVRSVVRKAGVLKLTASAAGELLALASGAPLESKLEHVAAQLRDAFGSRLCVVTDGSRGSALAVAPPPGSVGGGSAGRKAASSCAVVVPIYSGVTQKDATGAGDAFFGGVIAGIHAWGLPTDAAGLERLGRVAAATGAACVEVLGALPVAGVSARRVVELNPDCAGLVDAAAALTAGASGAAQSASVLR